MNCNMIWRQGDVMIQRVSALPDTSKPVKQKGDVILAHGEVTGHAHRLAKGTATEYRSAEQERFIEVLEKAFVTHEEHSTIPLPAGIFKITIQKEFAPGQIRNVMD